jgi:hypothetical protein
MRHLTLEELKSYRRGAMTGDGLLLTDRHLASCALCQRDLRAVTPGPMLPAIAEEMGEPVHLTYEEMSDYLDSKLVEAEKVRIDEHMQICQSCSAELRDLMGFDARLGVEPSPAITTARGETKASLLQRMRGYILEFFAAPQRLRLAGASVALVVLGVFSLMRMRGSGSETQIEPSAAAAHLWRFSSAGHSSFFYGGVLIVGVGLAGLVYALFVRDK